MNLLPHIEQFRKRRDELESALSSPDVANNNKQFLDMTLEYSRMKNLAELGERFLKVINDINNCLLYTSPSPRDQRGSRMPSSA